MTMVVELDGRRLPGDAATLAQALEMLHRACPEGRVVAEVAGDGQTLDQAVLNHQHDAPSYAVVSATSIDSTDLLRRSLLEAADALRQLGPRHVFAAEMIHRAELSDAVGELGSIMGKWEQIKQVTHLAWKLSPQGVRAGGDAGDPGAAFWIDDSAAELSRLLMEVKRSLHSQDWSALGDVLEDDMPALSGEWADMLSEWAVSAAPVPSLAAGGC